MPNGVAYLRLDPVEVPTGVTFHLEELRLHEGSIADAVAGLAWTQTGMDGQSGNLRVYYDTDRNPDNGKTLIVSGHKLAGPGDAFDVPAPAGRFAVNLPLVRGGVLSGPNLCNGTSCSYAWNTSGVPNGDYYIYLEGSDLLSTVGRYSAAPVYVRH
jgi:hypothetical protein